MRLKIKRIMAMVLIAVLLITMVPMSAIEVYADGISETSVSEIQAQNTEEDILSTDMDIGKDSEDTAVTWHETQEVPKEDESQTNVEANADMSADKEEVTEESEQIASENQQERMSDADLVEVTEPDVIEKEKVMADEISVPLFVNGESVESDSRKEQEKKVISKIGLHNAEIGISLHNLDEKVPLGCIMAADQWSDGHFKWYVNTGAAGRHYIFCMEKGKVMKSGIFQPAKYSGAWGTGENTFRIAVAMDYFKKHGGWSSEDGYVEAQQAIWNEGGTEAANHLIKYSNYLWQLTELNPDRNSGMGSYSDQIMAIAKSEMESKKKRSNIIAAAKELPVTHQDGYDLQGTIRIKGSAWKYFAAGNGWGSIEVAGCYKADGTRLENSVAVASVNSDGNLVVSAKQSDGVEKIATSEQDAILVLMKVNPTYEGSTEISYLKTGFDEKTQTLSYDASFSSPAYFAVKVYGTENTYTSTGVYINKIDEYGNPVDGAQFFIGGGQTDGGYFGRNFTAGEYVEIDKPGTYAIAETSAPAGMKLYTNEWGNHAVARFSVTEDANKQLVITPIWSAPGVKLETEESGVSYCYTIPNTYFDGDAVLRKTGNMFVGFENGAFVYHTRELRNVTFELYAAHDIYVQDTLLFAADQLITNEELNNSIWNQIGGHNTHIEEKTDGDGQIRYENLPLGRYYVVEKATPYDGYWVSGERLYFDITVNEDGQPTEIVKERNGYVNELVPAQCMVTKEDAKGKRLAGAEFTIYAHIDNQNYMGGNLFSVEQTRPAVVSRKNGKEITEENRWIPLETVKSDHNGQAFFDLQLPYGKYLVVETHPPKGEKGSYALAKESYVFEHVSKENDTFASGALFTHTFQDEEQENIIIIRKTGELLTDAKTEHSAYGDCRKLIFSPLAAKDVQFEIRDAAGDLIESLSTDEHGEARSGNLKPGTYYVAEVWTRGELKRVVDAKEVRLEANTTKKVQTQTVDFYNEKVTTKIRIHKKAETVSKAGVVSNVSRTDSLFEYKEQAVEGVVFGIFTKEDICNADGIVVVKADSCLGYCVTDKEGTAQFDDTLPTGNYYYKEVRTKDTTYRIDTDSYEFQVTLEGKDLDMDLNQEEPVVNRKYRGSIKVIKTDSVTKTVLQGVSFQLLDNEKKLLGTFVTDEHGEIWIGNLPVGVYYLQETKTLEQYVLDDSMREIVLDRNHLDVVMQIENAKQQENITEDSESDTDQIVNDIVNREKVSSRNKHVKTGDDNFRNIIFGFVVAVLLLIMIRRKEWELMLKRRMNGLLLLVVAVIAVFMINKPVHAESVGDIKVTNAKIYVDGKLVDGQVSLEEEYNAYFLVAYTSEGIYRSSQTYTIHATNANEDCEMKPSSGGYTDKPYTLIGTRTSRTVEVPDTIQVMCNVEYTYYFLHGEKVSKNDRLVEAGEITQIAYYSGMNVIVPEDCRVREIYADSDGKALKKEEIERLRLQIYKKDVNCAFRFPSGNILSERDYLNLCDAWSQNVKLYYGTRAAQAMRFDVTVLTRAEGERRVTVEPGYVTGEVTYELNGGRMKKGQDIDQYILGKPYVLESPEKKDYRFLGWYYRKDLSQEDILQQNEEQQYYLTEKDVAQKTLTIYAKWQFDVKVKRNGVQYQLMPDGTAQVIGCDDSADISIMEEVTYGGKKYPVTRILKGAYAKDSICRLEIPKSIYEIEPGAFLECAKLQDVYVKALELSIAGCFPSDVTLHAYGTSKAYQEYENVGYNGEKNAYASKIVYVLNGGENSADNSETYIWKSNLVLQPAAKKNARFDGWYMDSAFQENSRIESICEDVYQDVILYAKFIPVTGDAAPNDEVIVPVVNERETSSERTEQIIQIPAIDVAKDTQTTVTRQSAITKPRITEVRFRIKKNRKVKMSVTSDMAQGYCMEYATNKKLKHRNTIYISKDKYTFSNWKKGKTYYIRIRAYRRDQNNKRIYSDWTKVYSLVMK